jgi:putative choline sulfate-utilization transcription factor
MSYPFHRLPLRSLIVFEAAARHGKFVAAAAEMQMSQARISQQIAELEQALGVALFHRRYRGVELTGAGTDLLGSVRRGLQIMAGGFAAAQRLNFGSTLTILTDFGFAAWWLMPRIEALRAAVPQTEIRLTTVQSGDDFSHLDYDFGVLFGKPVWPHCHARLICREEVYPVCAPDLARQITPPADAARLARACLLDLSPAGDERWFRWSDWFRAGGTASPPAHRFITFNNYQMVLQAVLTGQGVALGWVPLIDDLLTQGKLVRLSDQPLVSERGYFLVEPDRAQTNRQAGPAKAWLLDAIGGTGPQAIGRETPQVRSDSGPAAFRR